MAMARSNSNHVNGRIFDTFLERPVADRWGGVSDTGGNNLEQILCTTHFRIFRAIRDSTEVPMCASGPPLPYLARNRRIDADQGYFKCPWLCHRRHAREGQLDNWKSEGELGAAIAGSVV